MDADRILKRINKAKEKKLLREGELQDAYRYVLPTRDTINKTGVVERGVKFDSTASNAIEKYATKLQNLLTPSWEEWLKFQPGNDVPKEEQGQLQEKLDELSDVVFSHIHHSNFYTAEHEAFLDLGISTGAMIVEANTRKNEPSLINCRSIPIAELIPEISSRGTIDTVYREFKVKVSEINSLWSRANIPEIIQEKGKQDESFEVSIYEGIIYNEKEGNYTFIVLEASTKSFLLEEEEETSPFIVFRESVRPNDVMGYGRALRIIEDIKTLNKMAYNALIADGLQSIPMFTAMDDGIFNPHNIRIEGGTVIPVSSNDNSNPSLRAMDVAGNYQLSENRMEQLRALVNETFLANPYGSIEQTPVRSATEIAAREADLFQSTAAASGRLQTEFLEKLMRRVISILKESGKVPDVKLDGREVAIKFTSPFAKMQGSEKVKNTLQWLGYVSSLGPDVAAISINADKVPGLLAKNMGIDKELYKDSTEVDTDKKEVAKMAAEMAQQGVDVTGGQQGQQAEQMPIM